MGKVLAARDIVKTVLCRQLAESHRSCAYYPKKIMVKKWTDAKLFVLHQSFYVKISSRFADCFLFLLFFALFFVFDFPVNQEGQSSPKKDNCAQN